MLAGMMVSGSAIMTTGRKSRHGREKADERKAGRCVIRERLHERMMTGSVSPPLNPDRIESIVTMMMTTPLIVRIEASSGIRKATV